MDSVSKMTGTPWHVETLTIGDDKRRHRSHCRHIDIITKECMLGSRCFGSTHCSYYEELTPEEEKRRNIEAHKRKTDALKTSQKKTTPGMYRPKNRSKTTTAGIPITIGSKVRSSVYKTGKVIEVKGNKFTVRFSNNLIKEFLYPGCLSFLEVILK